MAEGTSRLAVAAHPAVVAALVVLVVNDHVLKAWSADQGAAARAITGKASDVAGILLLTVLLGVLTGRRPAVVAVGIGFAALKLSPAVADLAVPLLGGRTRTDPWDLLALVALAPADRLLLRVDGRPAPDAHRAEASVRATLGVAVVVIGVPAMTATSCPSDDPGLSAVGRLDADTLVAGAGFAGGDDPWDDPAGRGRLSETTLPPPPTPPSITTSTSTPATTSTRPSRGPGDDLPTEWRVSDDAGRTWRRAPADRALARTLRGELPRTAHCRDDGWCIRTEGARVEERAPGGDWRTTFAYTDDDRERVAASSEACGEELRLQLGDVVEVDGTVVVGAGTAGILRRPPQGEWEQIGVGAWVPPGERPPAWPRRLTWSPLGAIALLVALSCAGAARSPGRWPLLVPAGVVAIVGTVVGAAAFVLLSSAGLDPRERGRLVALITGIVLAGAVLPLVPMLLGRRRPPGDPPGPPPSPGPSGRRI